MEKIMIKSSTRKELGKNACKSLRKGGFIPAIVYKGGKESLPILIESKDLWYAMHTEAGENAIITLDIADGKKKSKKTVIIQETQTDSVNDKLLHVDFHEISLTEKIKVKVPVSLKGEPVGVREEDGVLSQVIWEVEVECLPMEIPERIEVSVEELRIGDTVCVKDIETLEGVQVLDEPEQAIAVVNLPQAEEEVVPEEAAAEEMEEPELIKKGKKEEEEGAAAEEGEQAPSGE